MNVLKSPKSLFASTSLAVLIGLTSGCASVNSGLQAGELPPQGVFIAENGMQFNVQPLSLAGLPASPVYSSRRNSGSSMKNARVHELLNGPRSSEYRLAQGDVLTISLGDYPQIPKSDIGYPIDQQGYIQFPLVGRVKASGLSVPQFTSQLRNQLQRYLKYPDPQVQVLKYRSNNFFIDGAVKQSGEFSMDDRPVSLYGAISMAGGVAPEGDSNNVTLTRNGTTYELGLNDLKSMGVSANQIYLRDGDAVHVNSRDRNKVYVLGEFGSVKPVEIPDQGLSLTQVLGEVEGLDARTADAAKLYVIRDHGNASYTDIYHANLQSVTNLALANRFEMQPNDIVYVDPTGLTRWSRFIGAILPSAYALDRLN
ncbi:polysaccharide biosynthesis/export family protein [Psychrobacter raelei]|uniref:Polysaccharide biosynthesis/export family protein n=1 Tax=Psychrobacter raelei TaxID=2565531 RepID=A0AAT9PFZ6_9GAMM|nr:polysaccharide biosynthesis/export family protein [Psychrobacter sp. PraFG1]UNK05630.1 polysaccharide biosynthesis/export family protein [Psychrobacter sp. PraFG1]